MCRYNSQRLLYAQINKSSNGLQEGWGKARIYADNIAIVYQGFPPEQSTLLNRTTFRRRRPPKIKCISDVIESYRVLRHRVGGVEGRAFHLDIATFPLFIRTRRPMDENNLQRIQENISFSRN